MNLSDQTKLLNDLIKENPDATVRDFIETMADIEKITPQIMKPKRYTEEQELFILANHQTMCVNQISEKLGIPAAVIHNYGARNKLTFLSQQDATGARRGKIVGYVPDKPKKKLERPPAIYNNIPLRQNII